MSEWVQVAVGVVTDPQGRVLIARRPEQAHQGGLWEFPGGKVDPGETLQQALARELEEELALEVLETEPLIRLGHHYPDKSVFLDVHRVTQFAGEPQGNEGQPIRWVSPEDLPSYDFPAANRPIIHALTLPARMLITGPVEADFLERVEKSLNNGIRMIQLRCPELDDAAYIRLAEQVAERCQRHGAQLLCNRKLEVWSRLTAPAGLHLNSQRLWQWEQRPVPLSTWLGASCHTAEEIQQAQAIGVDYITLSPVAPTQSHPDASPLGWEAFAQLLDQAKVPVFALGGVNEGDIAKVRRLGGQGIAGIRFAW